MILFASRADFAYGNARLRARKSRLLSRADYEELLGKDVDGLLGVLASTGYAPEVEAALARFRGIRRIHEAVRLHLARSLEEMRSFYEGYARELVDLMLSRWDLHNVIALLRGGAAGQPSEEVLANVIPLGALSEALAHEIARQTEFAGAAELLVRWRLPEPETARSLREAWPEYERTENLAALEHAVMAGWALRTAAALARAGPDGGGLRRVFEREIDRRNVFGALRLREALGRGEIQELPGLSDRGPYLPGGSIRPGFLDAAVRFPDPEIAAAAFAGTAPENWRAPLERWTRSGDLVVLQGELESLWITEAVALFYRGDPLGVDVPVAYAIAKENEARNLRVVAEGAAHGLEPHIVRAQLVFATERSVPG